VTPQFDFQFKWCRQPKENEMLYSASGSPVGVAILRLPIDDDMLLGNEQVCMIFIERIVHLQQQHPCSSASAAKTVSQKQRVVYIRTDSEASDE
jgi:hypothetical protein